MAKPKKDIKSALSASIEAEATAFQNKFDRAEAYFNNTQTPSEPIQPEEPVKKSKVIRDSFTFPEADYKLIAALKARCLQNATMANKSEILRAGLIALANLSDVELVTAIASLPKVKTGRPSNK